MINEFKGTTVDRALEIMDQTSKLIAHFRKALIAVRHRGTTGNPCWCESLIPWTTGKHEKDCTMARYLTMGYDMEETK